MVHLLYNIFEFEMLRKIALVDILLDTHIAAVVGVSLFSIGFFSYHLVYEQYPDKAAIVEGVILYGLFAMMAISIVITIASDPGRLPVLWDFTREQFSAQTKKFCLICNNFKAERSHHCSTCGRCVLNMDHHCPWLHNCIGFYNRKPFMLSLVYGWLDLLFGICLSVPKLFAALQDWHHLGLRQLVPFVLPLTLIVAFFLILTYFFRFHVSLVLNNMTTIEHLEIKRTVFPDQFPKKYDLGAYNNFAQVFGEPSLLWLFPVFTASTYPVGDGLLWKKSQKYLDYIQKQETDMKPQMINFGQGDLSYSQQDNAHSHHHQSFTSPYSTLQQHKLQTDSRTQPVNSAFFLHQSQNQKF